MATDPTQSSQPSQSLYEKVVRVTNVYLGPAAGRFIDRQVQNHLHKSPPELSESDLLKLIDWIRVAVSLLTDDSEIIEEYAAQLLRLTKQDNSLNSASAKSNG